MCFPRARASPSGEVHHHDLRSFEMSSEIVDSLSIFIDKYGNCHICYMNIEHKIVAIFIVIQTSIYAGLSHLCAPIRVPLNHSHGLVAHLGVHMAASRSGKQGCSGYARGLVVFGQTGVYHSSSVPSESSRHSSRVANRYRYNTLSATTIIEVHAGTQSQ